MKSSIQVLVVLLSINVLSSSAIQAQGAKRTGLYQVTIADVFHNNTADLSVSYKSSKGTVPLLSRENVCRDTSSKGIFSVSCQSGRYAIKITPPSPNSNFANEFYSQLRVRASQNTPRHSALLKCHQEGTKRTVFTCREVPQGAASRVGLSYKKVRIASQPSCRVRTTSDGRHVLQAYFKYRYGSKLQFANHANLVAPLNDFIFRCDDFTNALNVNDRVVVVTHYNGGFNRQTRAVLKGWQQFVKLTPGERR